MAGKRNATVGRTALICSTAKLSAIGTSFPPASKIVVLVDVPWVTTIDLPSEIWDAAVWLNGKEFLVREKVRDVIAPLLVVAFGPLT
jgi:hypothetical protein